MKNFLIIILLLITLQLSAQKEIALFDSDGDAIAYISEDSTIYLWEGKPVAYLDKDNIYGFNGKHLGWFVDEVVRDHKGHRVGTTKNSANIITKIEPIKGIKQIVPIKEIQDLVPIKPLFNNKLSDYNLEAFLLAGSSIITSQKEHCTIIDDLIYYDSDMSILLGAVFLASGIVFLSNDVYLYPTYSFYQKENIVSNSFGWAFGLRRNFSHSALEYGGSVLYREYDNFNINEDNEQTSQWGGHINFIYDIFHNKKINWLEKSPLPLTFYVGASVNYIQMFGFGGILGTQVQLFKRLKIDLRYERTTQTNQLQAGLIFTYNE